MDMLLTASDGHRFTAWITGPENASRGIVILPEIFGINAHIRQMAEHYAEHGYRAICPSLFDRSPGAEAGIQLNYDLPGRHRGMALRKSVTDIDALLDIEAAAAALGQRAQKMITGYCWGGYMTWRAACTSTSFAAASCWYGGGIVNHCHDQPKIPVQLHFGEDDQHISQDDVATIRAAQPDLAIYTYPGAGHAFGREGNSAYHEGAARLAWERTLAFFDRQH
ncbi:MAG TPA: dienelactone hydrolase family protein [Castellaniella sp.]|uniref:dienelactone hydrolase family protein n=1 Tax=Castellaniella sp. TaxID=1955812 RepID=UPI002EEDE6FE